jgi:hypothetical protein
MHSTPVRSLAWSGAALALLLAVVTPGGLSHVGSGHVAFAQGTGQPSAGDEGDDDQGGGQTPNQPPGTPTATPTRPGQETGSQQRPSVVFTILQGPGSQASAIEEGDDIDEGLSNQRHDPDDD